MTILHLPGLVLSRKRAKAWLAFHGTDTRDQYDPWYIVKTGYLTKLQREKEKEKEGEREREREFTFDCLGRV